MIAIEVCQKCVDEKTVLLIRIQRDCILPPWDYDVKPLFTGSKRGWTYLDIFSASAILSVYSQLTETSQSKFCCFSLWKMSEIAIKLLK